jgi:hypothetical protein
MSDDEAYDVTPLKGSPVGRDGRGRGHGSTTMSHRWPWVLLGFAAALAAAVVPYGLGIFHTQSDVTCGAVPTKAPALVRRSLDGQVRNVLVTGGAGFIASHFALALLDRTGFNVTVVDDLSRGSIETILRLQV